MLLLLLVAVAVQAATCFASWNGLVMGCRSPLTCCFHIHGEGRCHNVIAVTTPSAHDPSGPALLGTRSGVASSFTSLFLASILLSPMAQQWTRLGGCRPILPLHSQLRRGVASGSSTLLSPWIGASHKQTMDAPASEPRSPVQI